VYLTVGINKQLRHELLVDDEKSQTLSCSIHPGQKVSYFLDRLHLFLKEVSFNEVSHLGVSMICCHFVHSQQRLVDSLLQLERRFDGLQGRAPVLNGGLGDRLESDPATPLDLVVDQLLCVLSLFSRGRLKPLGEAVESDVVTRKVGVLPSLREKENPYSSSMER